MDKVARCFLAKIHSKLNYNIHRTMGLLVYEFMPPIIDSLLIDRILGTITITYKVLDNTTFQSLRQNVKYSIDGKSSIQNQFTSSTHAVSETAYPLTIIEDHVKRNHFLQQEIFNLYVLYCNAEQYLHESVPYYEGKIHPIMKNFFKVDKEISRNILKHYLACLN